MHLLDATSRWLMIVFFVTTMLGVGIRAPALQLSRLASRRRLILNALVANFVAVPLFGVAIASAVPLPAPVAGALILLACAPGGLSALNFTTHVQGTEAEGAAAVLVLTLLSLVISPVLISIALPDAGDIETPFARAVGVIGLYLLAPLAVGVLAVGFAPSVAPRLSPFLAVASLVSFVTFMVVTGSVRQIAVGQVGLLACCVMGALIVACVAIGWAAGGPSSETRRVLASTTSIRNAALCLALVNNNPAGEALITPLLAFSLLMIPPNAVFAIYHAVQARRAASRAAGGASGKQPAAG